MKENITKERKYAEAFQNRQTPVLAGLNAMVYQTNTETGKPHLVGYATNIRINQDGKLQEITTLGFHGPRGFKSMGYSGRMTVGTFLLKKSTLNENGETGQALEVWTRRDLVDQAPFQFDLYMSEYQAGLDNAPATPNNGKLIASVYGAKCNTQDLAFQDGQLVTKDTEWLFVDFKLGADFI